MSTAPLPVYQAAVIGLGAIVHRYGAPDADQPYCHAGGFSKCPRFEMTAAADPTDAAHLAFTEKWGAALPDVRLYRDTEAMLAAQRYDCIVVCVRGPLHQEIMRRVFAAKPRVIFLEKPPTVSLRDQDELLALSRASGIPIVVSYSRHWGTRILQAERLVKEGLIGEVRSVVGYCGNGILSFASHTTELIHQFAVATAAGTPISVQATGRELETPSAEVPPAFAARGFEREPGLVSLHVRYSNGVLATQVGSRGDHGQFYADVFGAKGRLRVGFYSGLAAFDEEGKERELPPEPASGGPFAEAYDQIAGWLDGGPLPDCSEAVFPQVNEIGFGAIESIRCGGISIALPNTRRDRLIYANG